MIAQTGVGAGRYRAVMPMGQFLHTQLAIAADGSQESIHCSSVIISLSALVGLIIAATLLNTRRPLPASKIQDVGQFDVAEQRCLMLLVDTMALQVFFITPPLKPSSEFSIRLP